MKTSRHHSYCNNKGKECIKEKGEPLRVFVIGIIIIDKTYNMYLVLPVSVTIDVELSNNIFCID